MSLSSHTAVSVCCLCLVLCLWKIHTLFIKPSFYPASTIREKNILRHLSQALKHVRHCWHISWKTAEWKAESEHLQIESERKKKQLYLKCAGSLWLKKIPLIKNIKMDFRFTLSLNSNLTWYAVKCVIIHHKCILTWYLLTMYIYLF